MAEAEMKSGLNFLRYMACLYLVVVSGCIHAYVLSGIGARISGTITDHDTGEPIEGASIGHGEEMLIYGMYIEPLPLATSIADGTFDARLTYTWPGRENIITRKYKPLHADFHTFKLTISKAGYLPIVFDLDIEDMVENENGTLTTSLGVISMVPENNTPRPLGETAAHE